MRHDVTRENHGRESHMFSPLPLEYHNGYGLQTTSHQRLLARQRGIYVYTASLFSMIRVLLGALIGTRVKTRVVDERQLKLPSLGPDSAFSCQFIRPCKLQLLQIPNRHDCNGL